MSATLWGILYYYNGAKQCLVRNVQATPTVPPIPNCDPAFTS